MKNKIIITIAFVFTMLLGLFTGDSLATSLGSNSSGLNNVKSKGANAVGYTVTARYSDMTARNDLYCVMHNKALHGNVTFGVQQYVKIKGNVATNSKGKSVTNIQNGILAYILHKGEGYGSAGNYTTTQRGVYGSINKWYDKVGSQLGVTSSIRYGPNNDYKNTSIIAEAKNYAQNVGEDNDSDEVVDNTNKDDISVEGYSKDGESYVRVGPFNWSFSGTLKNVKVYGDNNEKITGVKFSRFKGNNEEFYSSTEDIKSGKDFYITIGADSGFTKIGKITAKHKGTETTTIYTAELWFLHSQSMQNLMLVKTGENEQKPDAIETKFKYDIKLFINIGIVKVDSIKTDIKLPNVAFIVQDKNTGKYIKGSGRVGEYKFESYVNNKDNASHFLTDSSGKINVKQLPISEYKFWEVEQPNKGYEVSENATIVSYGENYKEITNDYKLGNLSIEKVDTAHPEIKLSSVEFTLVCKEGKYAGKYVGVDSNGYATYSDTEVRIKTGDKGQLYIKDIWEGSYVLTEVYNPNYGYIIDDSNKNIQLEVKPYETTYEELQNEQVYVRLSGFIWQDVVDGKRAMKNDYYKTNNIPSEYVDESDIEKCNGITVRLKRISDNSIVYEGNKDNKEFTDKAQETVSAEKGLYEIDGGEYVFEYVRIDELSNYYVEFEYDGIVYKSVVTHLDNNNGSKAEDKVESEALDKQFTEVDSTGENRANVNNTYSINYNDTVEYKASIKYIEMQDSTIKNLSYSSDNKGLIHAKTSDANCNLYSYFVPGQTEIKYINLGLYERPQTDLAIATDVANVKVGVNGYWHVYKYGTRHIEQDSSDTWNVGVKFKSNGTYSRAIYKSDLEYTSDDSSKELQVYLTYKVALRNESTYLAKVNNIIDYFDSNYELISAGTGLDTNCNLTGNLNCRDISDYGEGYKKCYIDVNTEVKSGETNYIYVQFKLNRTAVLKIINNQEVLNNRIEINSYTSYKDDNGNTVAALDINSVPGNTNISDINTYEDDTDFAPAVKLELTNARKIMGSIFVDSTSGELKAGEVRQGDGIFKENEGEQKITSKVTVQLKYENGNIAKYYDESTSTWKEATFDTQTGDFEISGFVPDKYKITFIWGDKTYTVQQYKGTIYDSTRNQNDLYWYKDAVETRKTDAIDNYATRIEIDAQMQEINSLTYDKIMEAYEYGYTGDIINKMDSTTPTMEFGVEYDTIETDGTIDKVEFITKNIDFGIVERARQQLDMRKRVSGFKITLANGQVLADATVDENGDLQGSHDHVTYMGPTSTNGNSFKGYIRAEIDSELIEGATLEVTYKIIAINNSELDYASENYYKYGTDKVDVITITPSAVVDYLDKNLVFKQEDNTQWEQITDITDSRIETATKIIENKEEDLNNINIIYTEALAVPIEPTKTADVDLNVSKLLTTSDEMTFDNEAETIKVQKPVIISMPENSAQQHKGSFIEFLPTSNAESVEITPSTGKDKAYVAPIVIGISALSALVVMIIIFRVIKLKEDR